MTRLRGLLVPLWLAFEALAVGETCPASVDVQTRVRSILHLAPEQTLSESFLVERHESGLYVELRGNDAAVIGQRTLPLAGSCDELAQAAAVVLAACTELGLPEQREILIPREKLNGLLARRLTLDKTLLDVLHLRTGEPAVELDPQAQRLRVALDVSLTHPFSSRPLKGQATISGGLAFDAATLTVLLTDPRIEKLEMDSVPSALRDQVSRLGAALGAELLDSYPLHELKPGELSFMGQEYRVLGACDTQCTDVDLYVSDPNGNQVGSDVLTDDYPVVSVPAAQDGYYTIRIAMPGCGAESCIGAARVYEVQ